jgi:hypothetical protein
MRQRRIEADECAEPVPPAGGERAQRVLVPVLAVPQHRHLGPAIEESGDCLEKERDALLPGQPGHHPEQRGVAHALRVRQPEPVA